MRSASFFILLLLVIMAQGASSNDQPTQYNLSWNVLTGGKVHDVDISSDGRFIAAGSGDTNAYLLDQDGKVLWRYKTSSYITSVDLSDDGSYMVIGSDDSNIYFRDRNSTTLWFYDLGTKAVDHVAVAGDGSHAAGSTGFPDTKVHYFSRKGSRLWESKIGDDITALAVSWNGSVVAAGSRDKKIYVFDRDGRIIWSYDAGYEGVGHIMALTDGSVVYGTYFNKIRFLSPTGVLIWSVSNGDSINDLMLLEDNTRIAVYSGTGRINYYDLSGTLLNTRLLDDRPAGIALSTNSDLLVARFPAPDNRIYLFRVGPTPVEVEPPSSRKVVLVSNSIDLAGAGQLIDSLDDSGADVLMLSPKEFTFDKKDDMVIFLGGPDSPEGMGALVMEALNSSWLENNIRQKGSKELIIKNDVWAQGQKVVILAGPDRSGTREAITLNLDKTLLLLGL